MSKIKLLFNSLIGLKLIMALTGILLCLFLLTHVAGNMTILIDPDLFNAYAFSLTSNKTFLYTAEAGLIGIFLLHIYAAIKLTRLNRRARPVPYEFESNTGRSRRSWMSSNMGLTGTLILLFLIFHIRNFKFGDVMMTEVHGIEMRDLAFNVIKDFQQPIYVWIYVLAMVVLIWHLLHATRSFFATLGLENSKTLSISQNFSRVFVILVGGGFILIPLWIYFVGV